MATANPTVKNTIRTHNGPDILFKVIVTIICVFSFLVVLYPMYFIVIASFSDSTLVNQGQVILYPNGKEVLGYILQAVH